MSSYAPEPTPSRIPPRRSPTVAALCACLWAAAAAACSPSNTEETAVSRGDLAFARDSLDEALAEYRLAVRQGDEAPATLARVAHTYVRIGRVDEARDFYGRAADKDASLREQAAADFVHMARAAAERDDRFQMASAMDAALTFRPGLSVQELALPLARHFFESGEYGRALPFYQKALAATADSAPELVFEIGQALEQIGNCERALVFFERFRSMVATHQRGEVDWYIGNCAFQLARDKRQSARALRPRRPAPSPDDPTDRRRPSDAARAGDDPRADTAAAAGPGETPADSAAAPAGDPTADSVGAVPGDTLHPPAPPGSREELLEEALRLINRTLEVGEPRNLLGQAWFERGEVLAALGDCDGALEAFDRVRLVEPTTNTALARRAQERYDQIRFGRGLRELMPTGSCG